MRSLFLAALDCLVRNEPGVAAAPEIASASVRPTSNIGFILIRNSDGKPVQLDASGLCEMKNMFVAIIDEALGANRFEVAVRANHRFSVLDCDRLDPMNGVLQYKEVAQFHYELMGQHRVGWRRADVEKKRATRF